MAQLPDIKGLLFSRVRPFDPEEVTTRSDREVDPRDVGLRQEDIDAIWDAIVILYKLGVHPAIALCIRRRGEVIIDRAIGHARGNAPNDPKDAPKVKATPDTLYNFFSGSKCVTAMLIHLLQEQGQLDVDEPVATFIPEFAQKRKQKITIRDVLTHRAGIPAIPVEAVDADLLARTDEIVTGFCEMEPTYKPGGAPAYHAVTGGFILAEIIRRVTGDDIRAFHKEHLREPLGMKSFDYGVPPELLDEVALEAFTGPNPTWFDRQYVGRAFGTSMQELVDFGNDARFRTAVVPSGNVIATPEEISRFFDMLLCGGEHQGTRIFQQRTVLRATKAESFPRVDRILLLPMLYSMGFMLGDRVISLFGPQTGQVFGHLGFTNVLGWADHERDISVAFMNTGKPLGSVLSLAWVNVMRAICMRIPRDRT